MVFVFLFTAFLCAFLFMISFLGPKPNKLGLAIIFMALAPLSVFLLGVTAIMLFKNEYFSLYGALAITTVAGTTGLAAAALVNYFRFRKARQ